MSFSRQREPGLFLDGSVVTGAEFEYWDAAIASAFDPVGGGAYALEANVDIGGSPGVEWTFDLPLICNSVVNFESDFYSSGDATFYGTNYFYGPATFNDPVVFNDDINASGNAYFHDGSITIGADSSDLFTVNAYTELQDANFLGDIAHNGSADYYGVATFHAAATLQGSTAFEGTVVTNGVGNFRVRRVRRQMHGTDSDLTIDVTLTDHVIVRPGVLSGAHSYTLSDTGANNGDRVRFSNFDTVHALSVRNPGGGLLAALLSASGNSPWCDVERVDGTWRPFQGDKVA